MPKNVSLQPELEQKYGYEVTRVSDSCC